MRHIQSNTSVMSPKQGRSDNLWGPRAIGDHGAPVSSPTLKAHPKKPITGTRGISWGPLLSARVLEWSVCPCPNCQSAPA
ncbi:unnamed protein product, partial [Staurois parvus]